MIRVKNSRGGRNDGGGGASRPFTRKLGLDVIAYRSASATA